MLDSGIHEKIKQYIDLLKEYNETTNIYSKKSYDILDYHIADSLNLAEFIKDSVFMLIWGLVRAFLVLF